MTLVLSRALLLLILSMGVLGGCTLRPPKQQDDVCAIFADRPSWHRAALKAERRWGLPPWLGMAFIARESSFRARAKPPRKKLIGLIPWRRPSSAYGFAQATDAAWSDYRRKAGRWRADRDDFADAMDFVGWYNDRSHRSLGVAKHDAYHMYVAYYAGVGGFQQGTWRRSSHVKNLARQVSERAGFYRGQYRSCRKRLSRKRWFGIF